MLPQQDVSVQPPSQQGLLPSQQPTETRPKQNQRNEIVRLQSEITAEVNGDAPEIARGIFGDNADHPDMAQVSNQALDNVYRQKFMSGDPKDRQWLQAEAKRDPQQFLKVADRLNVKMPPPTPPPDPMAAMPPPPMPAPLPMLPPPGAVPPAAAPPMPMAPPAAVAPQPMPLAPGPAPGVAPTTPAPVILGPNGQPLPPSGALG
jgi:hypothetical protein